MEQPTEDVVDFAIAAFLEEGERQAVALPPHAANDLDTLLHALRQLPADSGALGFVSVAEDFFVMARVSGPEVRLLLSDVTAATEWPLARAVVDHLGLPVPDEEDEMQPAGDLGIVADLGFPAMDLAVLCDEEDLYPDEMLSDIADRIGFGEAYQSAVETILD